MILIAGGTGRLGSAVANLLHRRGLPVRVLSRETFLTHERVTALAEAEGESRAVILVLTYCGLRWGNWRL